MFNAAVLIAFSSEPPSFWRACSARVLLSHQIHIDPMPSFAPDPACQIVPTPLQKSFSAQTPAEPALSSSSLTLPIPTSQFSLSLATAPNLI